MSKTLEQLTADLCELSATWNNNSLVPGEERRKCRAIGEEINALGGIDAMREAFYTAKAKNKAAVIVQAFWDHVGNWRW